MRLRLVETAVFLIFTAGVAGAEIYEWRDAGNHRHFTNKRENIPAERQAAARVVVEASPLSPAVEEAAPASAAGEAPARAAQVVYDFSRLRDRYAEGLRDGLALAASDSEGPKGDVLITGPLAVAHASVAQPVVAYQPLQPLVTTSFDRGRSRHLTLRMLLQDHFQLERDGPFSYRRRVKIGSGHSMQAVLQRGLPRHRAWRAGVPGAPITVR